MTYKFNTGALFRAKQKTSDKSPDYQGEANIVDLEFRISGWVRTSKAGAKYLHLKFEGKPDEGEPERRQPAMARDFHDDDIPF
jgi:hypothetical protein